jgi:hypothetical protein
MPQVKFAASVTQGLMTALLMMSDTKTIRACVPVALVLLFNFFAALHAFFWRKVFEKF